VRVEAQRVVGDEVCESLRQGTHTVRRYGGASAQKHRQIRWKSRELVVSSGSRKAVGNLRDRPERSDLVDELSP
jgi:hypothetical protein